VERQGAGHGAFSKKRRRINALAEDGQRAGGAIVDMV